MQRRTFIQLIFFLHFLFVGCSCSFASENSLPLKPDKHTFFNQSATGNFNLVANEENIEDSDNIPQFFNSIQHIIYYNVLSSVAIGIPKINYVLHNKYNLLFIYLDIPPPVCS